ncbi:FKBP-type peptidyl-prolyl cis-trans isomerase [Spongiimicrobium sp. 2-473A-2-J]|uniref:FKBP-type peptidyl-prolyl cis-trans isomerase n=1 Tax=Eudoraea algarum TaxID=3417568 RepID=UPI003D36CCB6
MNKTIIFNLLLTLSMPLISISQKDSTFYSNGVLKSKPVLDEYGVLKSVIYYYENRDLNAEFFYEPSGALSDIYVLDEKGDTIQRSDIPKLKLQPKKDLSWIKWKSIRKGLQYNLQENGNSELIKPGDTVRISYVGYFINGGQFDNTEITGNRFEMVVGDDKYLESFQEGLLKFGKGSKGYLKIDPELAYGEKAYGNIPPNSTLVYELKVIE